MKQFAGKAKKHQRWLMQFPTFPEEDAHGRSLAE